MSNSTFHTLSRRRLLSRGLAMFTALLTGSVGLVSRLLAAGRPDAAFASEKIDTAITELFGEAVFDDGDHITLDMHELAENGAVVPVSIVTDLKNIESLAILAEKNPVPLVAWYEFDDSLKGYLATRIKLAESGEVVVCVQADGRLYRASKFIEVTIGGCSA